MRICYLANIDNIHARRWVRFFAERGNDVYVLCDRIPESTIEGVTVIRPEMNLLTKIVAFKIVRSVHSNSFFKARAYRRCIRDIKPDIVHGIEALVYGFSTAKSGSFPKVLTPWGNDIFVWPKRSSVARFLVTHALKGVDCITTNMPNLAESLEKEYNIPHDKVKAFSWGIDLETFRIGYEHEARELRNRLSISQKVPVIMSNRRIREFWGISTITDSIMPVLDRRPDACFVFLAGAKPDNLLIRRIEEQVRDHGLEQHVRIIKDFLTPREMAIYLNMADIFVSVPFSDLLSISILEGMACGAVPVLSDLPAYSTRITHGKNGFLVPAGDSEKVAEIILHCLSHPELMQVIKKHNRTLVEEKDDQKKNMLKMEDIYTSLVKHKR